MAKNPFKKTASPVDPFIENEGFVMLDGGLATELERNGHDLDHPLWSARLMMTEPLAIRAVHLSYLNAGSDCLTSASYQASYPGCLNAGMSKRETTEMLRETVRIAVSARREFLEKSKNKDSTRPVIAASIGPFGAYLANGAEYTGNYSVSADELYDFHAGRWEVLADTPADLLACETIPAYREAEVLLRLIRQTPDKYVYVSFSCQNGVQISDGTPIKECAAMLADCKQIVAVGVNCTSPEYISDLIKQVRLGAPEMPVVVYPNSGEVYDGGSRSWKGETFDLTEAVPQWLAGGARLIGGCCRTGPEDIKAMRGKLTRIKN